MSTEFDISNYIIDLNQFKIVKKNKWRGSCGYISIVKDKSSNLEYVAKTLKKSLKNEANAQRDFFNHIKIEHFLRGYPNIVNFIGFNLSSFQDNDGSINPTLFFELASNGTLKQYLNVINTKKKNTLSNTKKQICMIGIAIGAYIIHQNGIVHLDLKPNNILLDENFYPKISDFGSAKFIKQQNKKKPEDDDKSEGYFPSSDVSAPIYTSPEIINLTSFNEKADVYSYAYIMYEIISGAEPKIESSTILETFNNILIGRRPDLSLIQKKLKKMSNDLQIDKLQALLISDSEDNDDNGFSKLISECWDQDPNNRPNFLDIINRLTTNKNLLLPDVDIKEIDNYLKKFDNMKIMSHLNHNSDDRSHRFNFRTNYNFDFPNSQRETNKNKQINKHDIPDYNNLDELCKNQIDVAAGTRDIESCATVGYNLANGFNGFPKCIVEAIKYLQIAIEGGNPSAMNTFADLLMIKSSTSKVLEEKRKNAAKLLYKIAADLGSTFAMIAYSKILFQESHKVPNDALNNNGGNEKIKKRNHRKNNTKHNLTDSASALLDPSFVSATYSRSNSAPLKPIKNNNNNDSQNSITKNDINNEDDYDENDSNIQHDNDNYRDIGEDNYNNYDPSKIFNNNSYNEFNDFHEHEIEADSIIDRYNNNDDIEQQFEEEEEEFSDYYDNEIDTNMDNSNNSNHDDNEYDGEENEIELREIKRNEAMKYMKMAVDRENLIAISMYNEMFLNKEEEQVKTFSKSTYSLGNKKADQK